MSKNKVLSVFLIVGLLLMTLAPVAMAKKITITWWINPWRIAPPGLMYLRHRRRRFSRWASEEFMRLNPDVEVVYEVVTNQGFEERSRGHPSGTYT